MSCFVCHKRSQHTCSRNNCQRSICDICLRTINHVGGQKWVQCQEKFQYYCNVHLIRECFECKRSSDGCTKCASKRKRSSFSLVTTCVVCKTPIAKCGDCEVHLPEIHSIDYTDDPDDRSNLQELERCSKCKEYFCKDCGGFFVGDRYDMDTY